MKTYVAPISSILMCQNQFIIAAGQSIRIQDTCFSFERNINGLKLIENFLIAFGTKVIVIIDINKLEIIFKIKTNSVVCDVKLETDYLFYLTMRGEIYKINKNDNLNHSSIVCKSNYSITTGKFMKDKFIGGMWDGNIVYNNVRYKIHAGTVYDLESHDEYIISCSTDRSICVYDLNFKVIYKVYDYRCRIYKCGFIKNKKIVKKFVDWYNKKNSGTNIVETDLFYFGITEHGKLKVFCNDKCIYNYKDCSKKVTNATESEADFIVCFDNDTYEKIKFHCIEEVGENEYKIIRHHFPTKDKYSALLNLKTSLKMRYIENIMYVAIKNELNKLETNQLHLINRFDSPIKEIYKNVISTVDKVYVTDENHTGVLYYYRNIKPTSATNSFIGTRNGTLIYKDIVIKISNESISGILIIGNNLYMSSKDGCIYLLIDVKKFTAQCKEYFANTDSEGMMITKFVKHTIYKKPLCCHFLHGMFYEKQIFTYGFYKNNLMIFTLENMQMIDLDSKPRLFHFKDNICYYLNHGKLNKTKFSNNLAQNKLEDNLKNIFFKDKIHIYTSEKTIVSVKESSISSLACEDISCIYVLSDICIVGTLDGSIKAIKILDDQLWVAAEYTNTYRIMDLMAIEDEKHIKIYCIDSYGTCFVLSYKDMLISLTHAKQFDTLCTKICFFNEEIIMGTADGNILFVTADIEIKSELKVHNAAVNKVLVFKTDKNDFIASGGDDHRLVVLNAKTDDRFEFTISSRILDLLYIPSECLLVCLSTDRYLTLIKCQEFKIIKKHKIKIYGACRMEYDKEIIVVGRGTERIKIK